EPGFEHRRQEHGEHERKAEDPKQRHLVAREHPQIFQRDEPDDGGAHDSLRAAANSGEGPALPPSAACAERRPSAAKTSWGVARSTLTSASGSPSASRRSSPSRTSSLPTLIQPSSLTAAPSARAAAASTRARTRCSPTRRR